MPQHLGVDYYKQGRWNEAEELQARELRICSRVLGEDHLDALISMANLADIYHAERQDESIQLMTHVVKKRMEKISADHPDTIDSRNTLQRWLNRD